MSDGRDEERKVVAFERARRRPDPARVLEFAETARRLQRERQESADVVERVLRETPPEEWPRLATHPELRNSGALSRLESEVSARLEKAPQEALLLSDLAASIAETLPPDAYPAVVLAQLRAHAWKDRGQALSYVGRYVEALEAVDRAEHQLTNFGTLTHDRAVVMYVRAIVLQKVARFDESRSLLAECTTIFRDYGDARLQLFCGISEGTLLYRRGEFRAAYQLFVPLLEVARSAEDLESEARIQNNLGYCAIELRDFRGANIHLSGATARFTELGRPLEAARSAMTFGRLLVQRGQVESGLQHLHGARRSFLMHDLPEDAGVCGLEIVEALLISDRMSEAAALTREITGQFSGTSFDARALPALEQLQRAFDERSATVEKVQRVRSFLGALHADPSLQFAV